MPKKKIEAIQVGERWRVIIPVDLREQEGQETKWFSKKNKAEKYAADLQDRRDDIGRGFFRLTKIEQGLVLTALKHAGDAQTLYDAVEFLRTQKPKQEISLAGLIIAAVSAKKQSGKSHHYVRCFESSCNRFAERREEMPACHVQPHHVEQWINSNAEWSQNTKANYLRDVRTLFSYGVKHGFCITNPAEKVEKPVLPDASPKTADVQTVTRIMRAAERIDKALCKYLALRFFGKLRRSEALKVQRENVKESYIEVFGKRVRSRNRRLVTINQTLRAWLAVDGDYRPKNERKRLRAILRATAVGNSGPLRPVDLPQNAARRTAVSFHYAVNPNTTAKESGHSEAVLFQNYRELKSVEDAELYWSILPSPDTSKI